MEKIYFTFQSEFTMDEVLINFTYKKRVIEKLGNKFSDEFIKNNPLYFNSKLNRYQNFQLKK